MMKHRAIILACSIFMVLAAAASEANAAPAWSDTPRDITGLYTGQPYGPTTIGIATDTNPAATLDCSGTSDCDTFTVKPTVSPQSTPLVSNVSCMVQFTVGPSAATCSLTIKVWDTGVPASSVAQTITISTEDAEPTFTTTGPTIGFQSELYDYTAVTSDGNAGNKLTCTLSTLNTCGGTMPTDTEGISPHTCPTYSFTPTSGLKSCQFRLVVSDNSTNPLTTGQTTTVTFNEVPTFSLGFGSNELIVTVHTLNSKEIAYYAIFYSTDQNQMTDPPTASYVVLSTFTAGQNATVIIPGLTNGLLYWVRVAGYDKSTQELTISAIGSGIPQGTSSLSQMKGQKSGCMMIDSRSAMPGGAFLAMIGIFLAFYSIFRRIGQTHS